MSLQEYGQKKVSFVANHPDVLMTEFREPHKRFVERMDRDFTIHEVVPRYALGEIRLKSEHIAQKGGLASSAEQLLRAAREDIPAIITMEDDAVNRITAFYIALEYQGHCKFSYFSGSPESKDINGGPLTFLKELETRRRETPGLQYILLVDRCFRKKVYELLVEERPAYSSYAAAMWEVFHNHRYIWSDCRTEAKEAMREQADSQRSQAAKRTREEMEDTPGTEVDAGPSKAAQKRARQKARKEQAPAAKATASRPAAPPPEQRFERPDNRRVSQAEWKALASCGAPKVRSTCKFWNLSTGCREATGTCKFLHVCWQCGGDHKWCVKHFSG